MRTVFAAFLIVYGLLAGPCLTQGFCESYGPPLTLLEEYEHADMVLVGRVGISRPVTALHWVTDIEIEAVNKKHPLIAKATKLTTLSRVNVPGKGKALVFLYVDRGEAYVRRTVAIGETNEVITYLNEVLKKKKRPALEQLQFSFTHLGVKNDAIASDARLTIENADWHQRRQLARKLLTAALET